MIPFNHFLITIASIALIVILLRLYNRWESRHATRYHNRKDKKKK